VNDQNDEIARQAQASLKNAASQVSRSAKSLARKGGGAAKRGLKKLGKKTIKAAAKAGKTLAKTIVKFISKLFAMLGPIGIGILVIIILFAILYCVLMDERGSSGDLSLNTSDQNAVVQNDDGVLEVAAFTEPQALIDAYYKYLSCASQKKVYVKSDGSYKELSFFNVDQTADYSQMMDAGGLEKDYYLSPYFIKMTDELLHQGDFYYPEQIIKPVFSQACTVEGDTSGKKYVTALPIIDDGSDNAKHLLAGEDPVAVKETSPNAGERRSYIAGATGKLLAMSTPYTPQPVYGAVPILPDDSAAKIPGVWDYGFGSVLQYDAMTKDKSMTIDSVTFPVHYHKIEGDEETCYQTINVSIYPGDTVESVEERINVLTEEETESDDTEGEGEVTTSITPVAYPSSDEITYMLGHLNVAHMTVTDEDAKMAAYCYDDPEINSALGNGAIASDGVSVIPKSTYPLNVPVLVSAATFSGNVRYERDEVTSTEVLATKRGSGATLANQWMENCSQVTYSTNSCTADFAGKNIITRSGTITTTQPSTSPKEIKEPTGFAYLRDYESLYKIFVPNTVSNDLDFQERVYNEIDGDYQEELDMDKDNKITVMDMMLKLGLLKRTEKGYVAGNGPAGVVEGTAKSSEPGWEGLRSQGEATEEGKAELAKMGLSESEEDTIELIARCVMCEGGGTSKLNQLLIANVILNRIYSTDYYTYGFSAIDILRAKSQYACYDQLATTTPSAQCVSSVRQAINGELRVPANVLGQAAQNWSDGVFAVFDTRPYKTVYSYTGSGLSDVDRYGRPAMTLEEMTERAKELEEEDAANGITSAAGSAELPDSSSDSSKVSGAYLAPDVAYYAIDGFNPHRIVQFMNKQVSKTGQEQSFIQKMFSAVGSFFEKFKLFHQSFEKAKLFTGDADTYIPYAYNMPYDDMKTTVIQAATFHNRTSYSSTSETFDTEILQFIFVGPNAWGQMDYSSSSSRSIRRVPGTKSVFDGFGSPTSRYFQAASPWSSSQGYATVAAPSGTKLMACGPSMVESVEGSSSDYEIVMSATTQDNRSLVITYSGLDSVNVTAGTALEKGDVVGKAGDSGYNFSLKVDGVDVDPYRFFYGVDSGGSTQIVATALAEVGTIGGSKYWRYGGSVQAWCAAFVCWCANECGYIDQGIFPDSASCDMCISFYKNHGQWQDASGYEPSPGDSIFFDWRGDGRSDHVGLVKYVENGRVYTVEGNCDNSVMELNYDLSSPKIMGYGVMP